MTDEITGQLGVAWRLFMRNWKPFVLAELAIFAAWVVLEVAVVGVHLSGVPRVVNGAAWFALHLSFFWLFGCLMTGIHWMALQAVDGGAPVFRSAFGKSRGWIYLIASLLYWIVVVAGFCLAVVPGVIVAVRWTLFRFVLTNGSSGPLASLRDAARLSASHRWKLFRVLALSVTLNLAGAMFFGVGLLITFPVTLILRAIQFRELQQVPDSSRMSPNVSAVL